MGFFGDFIDDVFDLPNKILGKSADAIAGTLCLPIKMVEAAIEAGCKTEEEIEKFVEKHMD